MKVPSYSIAKTLTSVALISSGLDLGKKVGDYIEVDPHFGNRPVRAVLQHTSGLADYHALPEYRASVEQRKSAWEIDEMLERALSLPDGEVGKFAYSNIGYALMRKVLEALNGSNFFTAIKKQVFDPLDISQVEELSSLGDWEKCQEASESVRLYDPGWVYPGMVLATSDALARSFEGIFSGKLIDPKILFDRVAVDAPGHTFKEPGYGLGVMTAGENWVGHGGGGPGFSLFALSYPDGRAAHVAYTTESIESDAPLIEQCLAVLERK